MPDEREVMVINDYESDASLPGDNSAGSAYAKQFDPSRKRSRHLKEFELLNKIGKGTYGTVWRARDKENGGIVALKSVHVLERMEKDGVTRHTAREIQLLDGLHHENIVRLHGTVIEQDKKALWLSFEYCEHDMAVLMEHMQNDFTLPQIKNLTRQLLLAVDHMHRNRIMHRDIKIANLLYTNTGTLKLCDFGLARSFKKPFMPFTLNVCTLWYRGPELLFGASQYTQALDMWAVGCVIAEWLLHRPAMPGNTETEQIDLIINFVGTPDARYGRNILQSDTWLDGPWPRRTATPCQVSKIFDRYSKGTHELIRGCLRWDPFLRWDCDRCLGAPWFEERPPMARDMPSFRQHRNDDKAAPVIPSRSHKNFMSQFEDDDDNTSHEKGPSRRSQEDAPFGRLASLRNAARIRSERAGNRSGDASRGAVGSSIGLVGRALPPKKKARY